jgi:chemotaxis response regulator CheB
MAEQGVAVALLFGDEALGAQLRGALVELGARIVHEGPVGTFGAQAIADSGVDVIVVNLDDDADEDLDALYDAVDGDHPRLIFNDADASRKLEGWDRARWARHLAVKLIAAGDIDPPRPHDARAIEVLPPAAAIEVNTDENLVHDLGVPLEIAEARSEALAAELEALLEAGDVDRGDVPALDAVDVAAPVADDYMFGDTGTPGNDAPALSLNEEFDGLMSLPTGDEAAPDYLFGSSDDAAPAAPMTLSEEFAGLDVPDADYVDLATATEPVAPSPRMSSLSLVSDEEAEAPVTVQPTTVPVAEPPTERFALSSLSLAPIDDEPATGAVIVVPDIESRATEASTVAPPSWDLVEADDVPAVSAPAATAAEFGIEKMSASDFLAPEGGDENHALDPVLGLELVTMEEALAQKPATDGNPYVVETFLDSAAGSIRRVVVLGATGGSGDAAALLLAALPSRLPALVVLIQGDDAHTLAVTLAATSVLPVRVADSGRFAAQSSILIVPAMQSLNIRRDGQITLQPVDKGDSLLDPSFTQLAATFGADLTAIVFAGHGNDGVGGAQAVRDRGGRVWVEEPGAEASPMVAGIREERLESFAGHVTALAARLIEEMP